MKQTFIKVLKTGILLLLINIILVSCEDNEPDKFKGPFPYSDSGFYFVNEGNFTWGNGSLSFFSYDSLEIYNRVFNKASGLALGDIPLRVISENERLYVVVNNSGRIVVLDKTNAGYIGSIEGLISPRDFKSLDDGYGLVSSLYSDSLTVVNTNSLSISSYINIGCSSECILVYGDYIFVSNWSEGDKLIVLDRLTLQVVKSIKVVKEPSEMIIDKAGKLRVLCSGGYMNEEFPALISINPVLLEVNATMRFNNKNTMPSELIINSSLDTLYYLNGGIYRMAYTDNELPAEAFIESDQRNLYRLSFDQNHFSIVVSDAVDYVQKGYIYLYSTSGKELFNGRADIIPGKISN